MIKSRNVLILVLIVLIGTYSFGQAENVEKTEKQVDKDIIAEMLPSNYFIKFTIEQDKSVQSTIFVVAANIYSIKLSNECISIISIDGKLSRIKNDVFYVTHSIRKKEISERLPGGYTFTNRSIDTCSYITLDQELTIVDFGEKILRIKYLITDNMSKIEPFSKKKK